MRLAGTRPPRIEAVIRKLQLGDEGEDKAWFESLVNWTVPEHAWDILQAESAWEQVLVFAGRFSEECFPLHTAYIHSSWNGWRRNRWGERKNRTPT